MKNLHRSASDPRRCDRKLARRTVAQPPDVVDDVHAEVQPRVDDMRTEDAPLDLNDIHSDDAPTNVITAPLNSFSVLARRPVLDESKNVPHCLHAYQDACPLHCRDFCEIQDEWDAHIQRVAGVCSPLFWQFFLNLHTLQTEAINSALRAAKNCFDANKTWKNFPGSIRTLRNKIRKVPDFWPLVTHRKNIDISAFRLPVKSVVCEFIDPIWAWITAARSIDPKDMKWKPTITKHLRTGERMYGSGVECGEAFAAACKSCPRGTYPMCFSLHCDGTTAKGLSSVPICIGVANTNSLSSNTQYCLAYMPVVTGLGKKFYSTPASTELKFFIRNAVFAAILQVLETGAKHGVIC